MTDAIWTGTLQKGTEPGTVVGELRDRFGWVVTIRGVLQHGGEYRLEGVLGDPPPALRIHGLDDAT
jgi:hypothetical protein